MTAEIAILNKQGVALASDSAVTMRQEMSEKIKTSANKLFALTKYHPVGIMIYGNADLMAVPWETIIKIYRAKLGKNKFETLKQYSEDFISFLDNGNPIFSENMQKEYFESRLFEYFLKMREEIEKEASFIFSEKDELTYDDTKKITSNIIKKHYEGWKNSEFGPSIPESFIDEIIEKHKDFIDESIKEIFEKLPISKRQLAQLKETAANIFSKFYIIPDDVSGVVIAGFGEKDIFPSLKAYAIEGIVENRLKYKEIGSTEIGADTEASIVPFAQTEMVEIFMEGIETSYMDIEENYLNAIFKDYTDIVSEHLMKSDDKNKQKIKKKLQKISKEIIKDYNEKLKNYRNEKYTDPITSVVSMLPKDELATMAETLVSLTSFKRKVSFQTESVGGPIDVAVISKGDGFIWIKRKHYFKQELNPQFFANYNKEEIENGKE